MMLKPTLRRKHRYVAFKLHCEAALTKKEIASAVEKAVLTLFGENGFSLALPKLISFEVDEGIGIVRCVHTEVDNVKASLAFVTDVNGIPCSMTTPRVSGTIRKLKSKLARG